MYAAHDLPNSHKNLRNVVPVAVDIVVVLSAGASASDVASRPQAGPLTHEFLRLLVRAWECRSSRPVGQAVRDVGQDLGELHRGLYCRRVLLGRHCRLVSLVFGEIGNPPAHHSGVEDTPDARADMASIEPQK